MEHSRLTNSIITLVMLLAFIPVFTPALAASPLQSVEPSALPPASEGNQDCSNLDVVFIVDQSWAMSAPGTQEAADPNNERKFAVDAMIDLLTGLALDQCPGTHHRISVISYGSSARVDLAMYDIQPATADDANALRDPDAGIKKQIVADNLGSDNNPESAFNEAYKLWRTAPIIDDNEHTTKRAIIFLTNGISKSSPTDYAQSAASVKEQVQTLFPFDGTLLDLENCLAEIRKNSADGYVEPVAASQCMSQHKPDKTAYEESAYIWTVFLKPPGYGKYGQAFQNIISNYEEMSKAHGGEAIELKPNSKKDIPSTFRKILSYLAGVRPVLLSCGEFAMNPYLKEARVTVYTIDPKFKITLSYKDESGAVHSITSGKGDSGFQVKDYYSFGSNESYILSYPYAGIWTLTADNCDGLDTYYEQVVIDTSRELKIPDLIPQYEVAPFYDPEHPQPLIYEMHDKQTGTLISQASHPRFVVDTKATVSSPTGEQKEYTLKWNEDEQSFISTEPLLVSSAGKYDVRVIGNTYTHEGKPSPLDTTVPELVFDKSYVLFDITAQFEVGPVTPFTIDIVYPPQDKAIKNVHDLSFDRWPPLMVSPLTIQVRLLDRDGNMLPKPDEYLQSTDGVFTAYVEGEEKSTQVTLQPDAKNPGYFSGMIPDFDVVGDDQKVTVVMDESAMRKDRRPYNREVQIEFERIDQLFHTAQFWGFLLIFTLAYIGEEVIRFFAIRTNKVGGALVFQDGSTTITEFNLHSGKNWRDIKNRELKNYPQLGLRKIHVTNSSRRRTKSAEGDFVGTSFGGDTQPGIRVSGVAYDGRKFDMEIGPEQPTPYDAETSLTMMYQPIYKQ
ncbi:MAG: hypothetical protein Fur002_04900 [Anaerolineales bacterium]